MADKILVVDDMDLNRVILNEILSSKYEVIEACDGREALGIIRKGADDICAMFLDIVMPVMNGIEVLGAMNEEGLIGKFPVFIITGDDAEENEPVCRKLGATDFVRKPFSNSVIRESLEKALGR